MKGYPDWRRGKLFTTTWYPSIEVIPNINEYHLVSTPVLSDGYYSLAFIFAGTTVPCWYRIEYYETLGGVVLKTSQLYYLFAGESKVIRWPGVLYLKNLPYILVVYVNPANPPSAIQGSIGIASYGV